MTFQHSSQHDHESSNGQPAAQASALDVERPGDALALVRYTFGRLPTASLVLIGLYGGTTGGHLRLDLAAGVDQPRRFAEQAATWLAGPEADPVPDAVLALIHTDHAPYPQQQEAADLVYELDQILQCGYSCPLIKTWHAGGGFVRDFACTDPHCCPYPGLDIQGELAAALARSPQLNRLPGVSAPEHTVETFLGVPPAPDAPTEQMVSSARRLTRTSHPGPAALDLWEVSLREITATGRCESALNPNHTAVLLRSSEDPLLVQALPPLAAVGVETAQLGCRISVLTDEAPPPPSPELDECHRAYAAALCGATSEAPHWPRIEALDALLHLLIPYSGDQRLNLLALKGWIEWAKGSGTTATIAVETCLDEEPDHALAGFLYELFESSGPCMWARVKRHSHGWWRSHQSTS